MSMDERSPPSSIGGATTSSIYSWPRAPAPSAAQRLRPCRGSTSGSGLSRASISGPSAMSTLKSCRSLWRNSNAPPERVPECRYRRDDQRGWTDRRERRKKPPDANARRPDCEDVTNLPIAFSSERPTAILADVDALGREGAVRLLDCRLCGEGGAGLDVALAADFVAHDVRARGHHDPLVAFLVLDDKDRVAAAGGRRTDRPGRLDRAVGH